MVLEVSPRPVIGITMGDAAGIGPEIILKSLSEKGIRQLCRCVVIGDIAFLKREGERLGIEAEIIPFGGSESGFEVIDLQNLSDSFAIGTENSVTGKAAGEYIEKAVELWKNGVIDAICTAPISKRSLSLGGYVYPGHTEFLASLTNTDEFSMSFFADKLCVVLLSTHVSLINAIDLVKRDRLIDKIKFTDKALSALLRRKVKIAVAGLNPHASEGGMFGSEEHDEIEPAVKFCREENGIEVSGPFAPDTVFLRGHSGEFDAVVALYHDQATIAVKSLSFGSAVNVTLGLPVIRTSVDHGTAFDIAGSGKADASSMKAAIKLAGELILSSPKVG